MVDTVAAAQGRLEGSERSGTLSLVRKWRISRILHKEEMKKRKSTKTRLIFSFSFFFPIFLYSVSHRKYCKLDFLGNRL